jgi:hypothetical protein
MSSPVRTRSLSREQRSLKSPKRIQPEVATRLGAQAMLADLPAWRDRH